MVDAIEIVVVKRTSKYFILKILGVANCNLKPY